MTVAVMLTAVLATAALACVFFIGERDRTRTHARTNLLIAQIGYYEDAQVAFGDQGANLATFYAIGWPQFSEDSRHAALEVEDALAAARSAAPALGPEEVARADSLSNSARTVSAGMEMILQAVERKDIAAAMEIATRADVAGESLKMSRGFVATVAAARADLREAQADYAARQRRSYALSIFIAAAWAVIVVLLGSASFRWLVRPLEKASSTTRAIAAGELSARIPRSGPRELANLAVDVNGMADALIRRSGELNDYLSKNLESRTIELERANNELTREVVVRRKAEDALAHTLSIERNLKEQLHHQAFHDALTDLTNRAGFMDRLNHALALAARRDASIAVLFIDLDDFKAVNDSLGHAAGDQLLSGVAAHLKSCLRPGDTAARIGGDEFAILLEEVKVTEDAAAVATRFLDRLRVPMMLDGTEVFVRGSIGIAIGASGSLADELVRRADVAMYTAKADGKGQFAVYDPGMDASLFGDLQLAGELQRAVERGEFVLHYQPSVILSSQKIAGVEALVRWQHPTRGLVAPNDFVPVAEKTGLILAIGRWVIREACTQVRRWQVQYPTDPPLSVAVNISAREVHRPDLVAIVAEALRDSGLPPETLVLEITENLVMKNAELAIARLHELKALGVRLAIDDFGTGYSSLSYLRRFPVDILKIDKSFVDGVGQHGKERELAQSIIELGQTLNLEIVAEGVERADQLGWLKSRQCHLAQGFFFAHALDADTLGTLLGDTAGGAMPGRQSA